jgi:hypothetical protein
MQIKVCCKATLSHQQFLTLSLMQWCVNGMGAYWLRWAPFLFTVTRRRRSSMPMTVSWLATELPPPLCTLHHKATYSEGRERRMDMPCFRGGFGAGRIEDNR